MPTSKADSIWTTTWVPSASVAAVVTGRRLFYEPTDARSREDSIFSDFNTMPKFHKKTDVLYVPTLSTERQYKLVRTKSLLTSSILQSTVLSLYTSSLVTYYCTSYRQRHTRVHRTYYGELD